ncbi:HEAT repeat domain-containing protein [Thiohalobacter sp. IOR34]|uniref:HEAT repeat domain-containing protein n=1 Tax=Thiohalobacter sp. IOR34 TaxID=3057176 RepID=UPI0025B26C68|nr:HEAT repeat domain-containing protein [Thiohalobacter sp. IOR34]WJW74640.1 HEAT repeat domain-containing protein [Thiohalobacter sp. IOR34]
MEPATTATDARLLLGTHCPHCPTVLQGLAQLVKEGVLGRLEVVNIEQRPEIAAELGVRSVPWVEIGPFRLEGLRSPAELRQWAERAGSQAGMAEYLRELLGEGRLAEAIDTLRRTPAAMDALLTLLADPDTELQVRIGIGAIMEEFAGQPPLRKVVEKLGQLTRHPDPRLRNDACYYLGLSGDARARPYLQDRLGDADTGVRETASEALEALTAAE